VKRWKRLLWLGVGLALAFGVWRAFQPTPVLVEVGTVHRGRLVVTTDDDGWTRVRERYILSAPVRGRLRRTPLEPGDEVRAGTTIAAVFVPSVPDPLDARARAEALAQVRRAAAAVREAQARRDEQQAELNFAQRELARVRGLMREGFAAQRALQNAEREERRAREALRAAEFHVAVTEHELEVARAALGEIGEPENGTDGAGGKQSGAAGEADGAAHGAPGAARGEARESTAGGAVPAVGERGATPHGEGEGEKEGAGEGEREGAGEGGEGQGERGGAGAGEGEGEAAPSEGVGAAPPAPPPAEIVLRSPIDGRVLRVFEESTRTLQPGEPILEIGDTSQLEVVADYLSQEAVKIRPGMEVLVRGWGGESERGGELVLRGRVRLVEPGGFTKVSALGVEEQRVNVLVDPDGGEGWPLLGDGYRVELQVILWQGDDVLLVPSGALFRRHDAWSVFRIADGAARRVEVELGRSNALYAEVLSGLQEGDSVVLYPTDLVADGTLVEAR
jgi:HlyD family secretion protein